jgi:hypothetical protein
MDKSDEILEALFSVMPDDRDKVRLVIWYGNKEGKDIDLFLVFEGSLADTAIGHHICGPLDIGFVGENRLQTMIRHLDPIIVEPILTGRAIFGETGLYYRAVLDQPVDREVPPYLLNSAEMFYGWAVDLANQGLLRDAVTTLSFVQSYLSYVFRYWGGSSIVLFKDLLASADGLAIKRIRRRMKKQGPILDSELYQSFAEVRQSLTKARGLV